MQSAHADVAREQLNRLASISLAQLKSRGKVWTRAIDWPSLMNWKARIGIGGTEAAMGVKVTLCQCRDIPGCKVTADFKGGRPLVSIVSVALSLKSQLGHESNSNTVSVEGLA